MIHASSKKVWPVASAQVKLDIRFHLSSPVFAAQELVNLAGDFSSLGGESIPTDIEVERLLAEIVQGAMMEDVSIQQALAQLCVDGNKYRFFESLCTAITALEFPLARMPSNVTSASCEPRLEDVTFNAKWWKSWNR